MACACSKNKTAATVAERRQASQQAKPASAPKPAPSTPAMRGTVQSFSMEANGMTGRYGSQLERDAAVARTPGARPA